MNQVYPYGSGSAYTSSFALRAGWAPAADYIQYTLSSSTADIVLFPESGSRGTSVCLLTYPQYLDMVATGKVEICDFS